MWAWPSRGPAPWSAPAGGTCRGHGGARGGRSMEEAGGCPGRGPGPLVAALPWERGGPPHGGGDLEYVDLDEFLREHGLPPSPEPGPERPPAPPPPRAPPSPGVMEALPGGDALPGGGSLDPRGGALDPRRLRFGPDELRPQPMARKARKVHVPEEQKDEKYWSRRSRNNAAARRSREARRLKENQLSARAALLERDNAALRHEVAAARRDLARLRALLARYEARHGAL